MSTDAALLLAQARNALRTPADRRIAWDAYEREQWYAAVHGGRLWLCDLDAAHREAVYRLICERTKATL